MVKYRMNLNDEKVEELIRIAVERHMERLYGKQKMER